MKPLEIKKLAEHPEGGRFLEVYRSGQSVRKESGDKRSALTHIYFSLAPGEVSRFHKVESDEVWNLYEGTLILYVWNDSTQVLEQHKLSSAGKNYCTVVEAGKWQAAKTEGGTALVGCSVAPGFEYEDFTLIDPDGEIARRILDKFPELDAFI